MSLHFICQILEPIIRCPIFAERQDSNQPYASGMMRVQHKVYNHLTTQANGSIAIIINLLLSVYLEVLDINISQDKNLDVPLCWFVPDILLEPQAALEGNCRLINCVLLVHGTAKSSNFLTLNRRSWPLLPQGI